MYVPHSILRICCCVFVVVVVTGLYLKILIQHRKIEFSSAFQILKWVDQEKKLNRIVEGINRKYKMLVDILLYKMYTYILYICVRVCVSVLDVLYVIEYMLVYRRFAVFVHVLVHIE